MVVLLMEMEVEMTMLMDVHACDVGTDVVEQV